jgi:serine/threonine kinase PknH
LDGTPFGRYRLVELLGRGGMGEVWRAFDTDTDRVVALKHLPPHLSEDEEFQRRFRREAHAAAQLNDPHVIPIHHYGEIDGRLYVDMRLIEGRDLQSVLADGPLDPARAVRIVGQVAEALNAAHQVGLLHRDVKPSNILLGHNDFAYLIDFGIARAADETRLTKSGNTIGTFAYIAPERLDGRANEDARVDIYSLTCVLYEALTGRPPFAGDTTPRLIAAHLNEPPPRPSINRPEVPGRVDEVIATGMAKDPDQRYATTIELADAARDALTVPEPTLPREPVLPAFAPKPWGQQSADPTLAAIQQHRPSGGNPVARPGPADHLPPQPVRTAPPRWWSRPLWQALMVTIVLGVVIATAAIIILPRLKSPAPQPLTGQPGPNTSQPGVATPAVPARPPRDLTGSTVSLSASSPTRNQVITNVVTGTVPVSWATGSLYSVGSGHQVQAAFDVTATQVSETFLVDTPLSSGQFNGPVYTFTGAPPITNVTFNAAQSAPGVAPTSISYDANTIAVNDSGISVTNGAKQVLDVTFAQ